MHVRVGGLHKSAKWWARVGQGRRGGNRNKIACQTPLEVKLAAVMEGCP